MKDLDYTVLLLHNCVDTKNVRNPRINRSKKNVSLGSKYSKVNEKIMFI